MIWREPEVIRWLNLADKGLSAAEQALAAAYSELVDLGADGIDDAIKAVSGAHAELLALHLEFQRLKQNDP